MKAFATSNYCALQLIFFLFTAFNIEAQPRVELVNIIISPDHDDWTYKLGEQASFDVSVLKYGIPLTDIEIGYEIRPEKLEPTKKGKLQLKRDVTTIKAGTMKEPGFLRCWVFVTVDGKEYRNMATAAFSPEQIKPVANLPSDFKDFWSKAIEENGNIPLDTRTTLLPDRCTEKVDVYHVSIQNFKKGSRIYGILCKPKKDGKYPAILEVPGAGIRPYYGRVDLAEEGIISLQIGIHGIPVTMEQYIYDNLRYGALNGYWEMNPDLLSMGLTWILIAFLTVFVGWFNSRSILNKSPLEVLRKEV